MKTMSLWVLAAVLAISTSVAARTSEGKPAYEVDASVMDDSLTESVRSVLESTVGHRLPVATPEMEWITTSGAEEADGFEDFSGRVVVLQSFDVTDRRTRGDVRRVRRVLRGMEDRVAVIGVHPPSEARDLAREIDRHARGGVVVHDPVGAWCDELGIYKQPTTIVVDGNGVIRHAGIGMRHLRGAVGEILSESGDSDDEAPALPLRAERVDEASFAEASEDGAEFPAHVGNVGRARNVQGQKAPEIVVEHWITSTPELEGKVVIVEFWATWCGPCIRNIPHMNDLAERFGNAIAVIGVSDENPQKVRNFVRGTRIGYAIATDPQRRLFSFPRPAGIPHAYVQSPDGVVRWQGHPAGLTEEALASIVRASRALSEPSGPMRWVTGESPDSGE